MLKLKIIVAFLVVLPIQYGFAQDLIETHQLALENDPELQSSYLKQYSIAEFKSQSIAQMLPAISLIGSSARERLNNKKTTFQGAGTQNYWNNSFSINFKQPVFNWSHWIQLDQSNNRIAQAEAQYQATYQQLIVTTTERYFNILAAQDNLDFSVAEKQSIEKQLEQAKQRFKVGLIAITDVYEAQAGYDQARANEIEASNLLDDTKESLKEIIGENDVKLNKLVEDFPLLLPEPADISLWSKSAESNNFSIVAQLNQAEIIRKEIKLQKSGHLPTIDIVANYGVQDNTSNFGLRGDTQSIGLQLNLPLFKGGAVYSRGKQAQYEYQREKQNLIKIKRTVARQVKNAYRDVISSISRTQALQAAVKSSISALDATEAGFEVGTRTMVDILAEQRNLYHSKRDYARSRYNYLLSSIKLKQASGSLSRADLQQINLFLIP